MPFYTFKCTDCSAVFEEMLSFNKYEEAKKGGVLCSCGSNHTVWHPTYKCCFVGCSDLKANDHDYRFKDNFSNVLAERERAEQHSSVGNNPYGNIDDLGDNFGEVK